VFERGERDKHWPNCEYSCYHDFLLVIVLFIVTIKCVIYKSSRCVCAPVPPGNFHYFEQNNMGKIGLCYGVVKQNLSSSRCMSGLFKNISIKDYVRGWGGGGVTTRRLADFTFAARASCL
jgi:hypothetical protein